MTTVQYTIKDVPRHLDAQLRLYAKRESKSLNAALIDALFNGLNAARQPPENTELLKLAGSWVEDPAADRALADMDRVDEELWR